MASLPGCLAGSGNARCVNSETLYRKRRRGGRAGRRGGTTNKQIQCWAECDLRDLVWLLLLACAAGSGLSVGVFYMLVQRQQNHQSTPSWPISSSLAATQNLGIIHAFDNLSPNTTMVNGRTHTALKKSKVAIFYNVYDSNNPFDITATDALPIIREQLEQIANSSFSTTNASPTIYYTTIGKSDEPLVQACAALDLTCRHLQHFAVASETATLTRVHEYCLKYPTHSVVYLHNKGSLHHSKSQDRWRQALTQSALSADCLTRSVAVPFQCNICGLLFQPLPASHFPGNMWSATCHYVRQLLPPHEYHVQRPAVDDWIRREQNTFLFRPESHFVGKNRYEAEHWIGSHPSLRPCDVSTSPNLDDWIREGLVRPAVRLEPAPRTGLDDRRWIFYKYLYRNETLSEPNLRLRDYFLLRGIIYKWMVFYKKVADDDSWVWQWYPDGIEWQAALASTNDDPMRAIQVMTNASGSAAIVMPVPTLSQLLLEAGSIALDWMNPWNGNNGEVVYEPF
jgi:hypothetical protein